MCGLENLLLWLRIACIMKPQLKRGGRPKDENRGLWLEDIVEKLEAKHDVTPEEVEEIFIARPEIKRMNRGHFRGEDVYRALGQTEAGRYLAVFFIHKVTNEALVLSARDMDKKDRKGYAERA
jgi:uncharacterized DUF497 family protein